MPRWFKVLLLLVWLTGLVWLVSTDMAPGWFSAATSGYRDLLPSGPLFLDSWARILVNGQPIGYAHTTIDTAGDSGQRELVLESNMLVGMDVLGTYRRVRSGLTARLDASQRLQQFRFVMQADPYAVSIKGARTRGDLFEVQVRTPAGEHRTEISIPDDVVLYSSATDLALRALRPGQTLRIKTFDPVSLSEGLVRVEAVDRETITLAGENHEAMKLKVLYRGMEVLSWVDAEGQMLRQETPLGWTIERCDAGTAIASVPRPGETADIILASAVPLKGQLTNPRTRPSLRLRLKGPPALQRLPIGSPRQHVEKTLPDGMVLRLERASFDTPPAAEPPGAGALAATAFLQSDHADMMAPAQRITGDASTDRDKAEALLHWVYRNVRKQAAVSLPSALDVLRQLEGDCNEHTYLFVALARAAGLPAKVRVGIVYSESFGGFYYHAWPTVFVDGRWVEMDPTFGQTLVDATHLALLEGELEEQLQLLAVIGRLDLEVLPPELPEGDTP